MSECLPIIKFTKQCARQLLSSVQLASVNLAVASQQVKPSVHPESQSIREVRQSSWRTSVLFWQEMLSWCSLWLIKGCGCGHIYRVQSFFILTPAWLVNKTVKNEARPSVHRPSTLLECVYLHTLNSRGDLWVNTGLFLRISFLAQTWNIYSTAASCFHAHLEGNHTLVNSKPRTKRLIKPSALIFSGSL